MRSRLCTGAGLRPQARLSRKLENVQENYCFQLHGYIFSWISSTWSDRTRSGCAAGTHARSEHRIICVGPAAAMRPPPCGAARTVNEILLVWILLGSRLADHLRRAARSAAYLPQALHSHAGMRALGMAAQGLHPETNRP